MPKTTPKEWFTVSTGLESQKELEQVDSAARAAGMKRAKWLRVVILRAARGAVCRGKNSVATQ